MLCAPASCVPALPGIVWRSLIEPMSFYPWSALWRAGDCAEHVKAFVTCAGTLSRRMHWLDPQSQPADQGSASFPAIG